jgi:hypothetical protein
MVYKCRNRTRALTEKIAGFYLECLRDREQVGDTEVPLSPLDCADVAAIDAREVGEGVLTEFPLLSERSNPRPDCLELRIERRLFSRRGHPGIVW